MLRAVTIILVEIIHIAWDEQTGVQCIAMAQVAYVIFDCELKLTDMPLKISMIII